MLIEVYQIKNHESRSFLWFLLTQTRIANVNCDQTARSMNTSETSLYVKQFTRKFYFIIMSFRLFECHSSYATEYKIGLYTFQNRLHFIQIYDFYIRINRFPDTILCIQCLLPLLLLNYNSAIFHTKLQDLIQQISSLV